MDSTLRYAVDLARESDIPAIADIVNWAATNTTANFGTEPEPVALWEEMWRSSHQAYPWLVARRTDDGGILGFAKASAHKTRGAYRYTADVTVYVAPEAHGVRVGTTLYGRLIPMLRAQGIATLLAGISPPNPKSERLHEAHGFVRCGTYHRAGWKFGAWHDVGYWELHLNALGPPPAELRSVAYVWAREALSAGAPHG